MGKEAEPSPDYSQASKPRRLSGTRCAAPDWRNHKDMPGGMSIPLRPEARRTVRVYLLADLCTLSNTLEKVLKMVCTRSAPPGRTAAVNSTSNPQNRCC